MKLFAAPLPYGGRSSFQVLYEKAVEVILIRLVWLSRIFFIRSFLTVLVSAVKVCWPKYLGLRSVVRG